MVHFIPQSRTSEGCKDWHEWLGEYESGFLVRVKGKEARHVATTHLQREQAESLGFPRLG